MIRILRYCSTTVVLAISILGLIFSAPSKAAQSRAAQSKVTPSKASKAAQAPGQLFKVANPTDTLIPQYLLPCIHSAEVQKELRLTPEQIGKVEAILQELDLRWWPARNLDSAKQRELIAELEAELLEKLKPVLSPSSLQRLQSLELQVQGPRLMLRPDVAQKLGVSTEIQQRFRQFAAAAEKEQAELQKALKTDPKQELSKRIAAAKRTEIQSGYELLTDTQKQEMANLLGKMLDFSKMERVYPMAPELIDSGEWFGKPTTVRAARGKVLIVHFYAFQCFNCRNNFGKYKSWTETFKDQDVVSIGIQTPETPAEADPELVREAAERDKMTFPVLIDLGSKNWAAWGNTMWPTVYVVDKRGYIRMWWQGELNWQGATGDQTIIDLVNRLMKE